MWSMSKKVNHIIITDIKTVQCELGMTTFCKSNIHLFNNIIDEGCKLMKQFVYQEVNKKLRTMQTTVNHYIIIYV